MMQPISIGLKDNILIVAPHPDDECIGPGGILCTYAQQCSVIVLTDGAQGQGNCDVQICKNVRKEEFVKEMQYLHINDYKMLDIADGTLMQHTDCLHKIDLSVYSKIFVTGPKDNHFDHTAAYIAVRSALQKQALMYTEVYIYEVHNALEQPGYYLNISACLEEKMKLIRMHSSQLEVIPYDKYAECSAMYRALQNRMKDQYLEVYAMDHIMDGMDCHAAELENTLGKFRQFYQILTKWMLKKSDASVTKYFKQKGFRKAAIYGYAELGRILRAELDNCDLELLYVMDKNVKSDPDNEIDFYVPNTGLPEVDVVIVTAVYYFNQIEGELKELGYQNIISLQTVIDEM